MKRAVLNNAPSVVRFPDIYSEYSRKQQEDKLRDQVVLDKLYDILTADVSEVVEHRRVNCRYCHGENFEYQRKDWEMDRDLNAHIAKSHITNGKIRAETFDKMGGGGFDDNKAPNTRCPNCQGHGTGKVYVRDTAKLSQSVKNAISLVKHTRYGVEIRFHDWLRAFQIYAQMRGLIIERKQVSVLDLTRMPEEQLDTLLAQSAPLIDQNDPELAPFVDMMRRRSSPSPVPSTSNGKAKRALLSDE